MPLQSTTIRSRPRRVCVLSGGGDAPGVNAILRAFVHTAREFSIEAYGSRFGFEGLLDPSGIRPLTVDHVRGVLPKAGSLLGCSTSVNPFFTRDVNGAPTDAGPAIVDRLRSLEVDALVLIGGDGTMVAAQRFVKLGLPCIGVPKTIDNDLGETDVTCGFDSAVEVATRAVDALHSTGEAHARVLLLEVMGRNAGWIALHSGIAGGADVVLLPEVPYDIQRVVAKIRQREALGLRFSMIVVAEGARPIGGDVLQIEAGRPGHLPRLGGAGARLMRDLEELHLGHEMRLTVLGLLQRGGSPSAADRVLGSRMGARAAELCHQGTFDVMLSWRGGSLETIPLDGKKFLHKQVPLDSGIVSAARLVGIELGG